MGRTDKKDAPTLRKGDIVRFRDWDRQRGWAKGKVRRVNVEEGTVDLWVDNSFGGMWAHAKTLPISHVIK